MRRWAVAVVLLASVTALTGGAPSGRAQGQPLQVGGSALQLASGRGSLWLVTCDRGCSGGARTSSGRIVRIDPRTGRVVASVRIARPQSITVGVDGVFGLDFWRGEVYRIDPTSLRVTRRLHLRLPYLLSHNDDAFLPQTISLGEGSVWVTSDRGAIARIDPRTLRLQKMIAIDRGAIDGATAGRGAAWAAGELGGIARIDLRTYRVAATIKIDRGARTLSASQLLLAGGNVLAVGEWAKSGTATTANAVARIKPHSLHVEGVTPLPGQRFALTLGDGFLWAARTGGTTLVRIDPRTGTSLTRHSGRIGSALAFADGYLWTVTRNGALSRLASE